MIELIKKSEFFIGRKSKIKMQHKTEKEGN